MCYEPCRSLEVPSGTYLRITFLRRYCTRPYRGDFSSYDSTATLASLTLPVPLPRSWTVSRLAYLSRNLPRRNGQRSGPYARGSDVTYHPPASVRAAWYASTTAASSNPFKLIACTWTTLAMSTSVLRQAGGFRNGESGFGQAQHDRLFSASGDFLAIGHLQLARVRSLPTDQSLCGLLELWKSPRPTVSGTLVDRVSRVLVKSSNHHSPLFVGVGPPPISRRSALRLHHHDPRPRDHHQLRMARIPLAAWYTISSSYNCTQYVLHLQFFDCLFADLRRSVCVYPKIHPNNKLFSPALPHTSNSRLLTPSSADMFEHGHTTACAWLQQTMSGFQIEYAMQQTLPLNSKFSQSLQSSQSLFFLLRDQLLRSIRCYLAHGLPCRLSASPS